jgi:integrase/recombinase XerD
MHYLAVECGLSRHTIMAYGCDLGRFNDYLEREEGALRPERVEADHVHAFLWLEERRGLKAPSRARALVAIKGLFRFLVSEGFLERSRVSAIESPGQWKRLPGTLTEEEVRRIIEAPFPFDVLGLRNRALLEMLYATGARASEVSGIDVSALRLDVGFLRVMGKGRRERIVPLGERARVACEVYLNEARPALRTIQYAHEPALFLSRRGRRLCRNSIWRVVKARACGLGILKDVSPHTFRHSFATHMLENGAGIRSVQEMLGHASVKTTQIYTHVSRAHLRAVHRQFHPRA